MAQYSISSPFLQLELQAEEKCISGRLICKQTGGATPMVPLLELEIYDRMQERIDLVSSFGMIHVEECGEAGLHVTVRDSSRGVAVGLWLYLEGDELRLLFPPSEVEDSTDILYRLFAAKILPGMISTGPDGVGLLPLVSGMTFAARGQPKLSDRFLVYGEQCRWELLTTLPLCGMKTAEGGWLALATKGASESYCSIDTDGEGNAAVALYPMLRQTWIDSVDWTNRELRIRRLLPKEDLVITAAKRLRRHLVDDMGKTTLKERALESPECAYQQSAFTMKLFHGAQRQGIMMEGRAAKPDELLFQRTMTFSDASKSLRKLRDAGIDRIYLQSVGWNPRGHDGAWPTDFPIEERLGGESGFRTLISDAKELGYHITTHLNLVMANFGSPDFREDWVLQDLWGAPKLVGCWSGGPQGSHWGLAVPDEVILKRLQAIKDLGMNGMLYLDGMANPLYPNYHSIHKGPRSGYAAGINKFLELSKQVFGAVGTEMGYLYCLKNTDSLVAGGGSPWHLMRAKPEWPIVSLKKELVPVWDLAVHDLVTKENKSSGWKSAIQTVLFGSVPRDEWTTEPGIFPVLNDARIALLKAKYDLCCKQFGHLIAEEITNWRRLDEFVEETVFGDGTTVLGDLREERLLVNGKEIQRPSAFPLSI